jgi:hypothetical protein
LRGRTQVYSAGAAVAGPSVADVPHNSKRADDGATRIQPAVPLFVGLSANEVVWHPTIFTKNRDWLLEGAVAEEFFSIVVNQARGETPVERRSRHGGR